MRRQDVQEPCCRDKEQCSVSREHLGRYRDACALCAVVALIALASGGIWNTTAIGPTPSSTSSASSVSAESDGLQGEQEDSASEKALFKAKRQRRGKIKFRTHRDDQRRRRKKSGSKKGGRPTSRPPQVADYMYNTCTAGSASHKPPPKCNSSQDHRYFGLYYKADSQPADTAKEQASFCRGQDGHRGNGAPCDSRNVADGRGVRNRRHHAGMARQRATSIELYLVD